MTPQEIDKIKNEIMRRTDITACLNEDEIATFFEVCELAKERVFYVAQKTFQDAPRHEL